MDLLTRPIIHLCLHIFLPAVVAKVAFARQWQWAWFVMLSTMLIDLDHLLANPLYDPDRCSIGFHPLHTIWVMPIYVLLLVFPKTRLIGIGLIIHILLDGLDCVWMKGLVSGV